MTTILAIATILGGVAALMYFWEKYKKKDKWHEEDKIIDSSCWESSEIKKIKDAEGFTTYRWSNPEKVAGRKANGYLIIYEEDKKSKTRYQLINKGHQLLIGKK
ncbi:MAG: hypothetical protein QW761_02055 [Candidatus Aenigmatarchaeota archaeon]